MAINDIIIKYENSCPSPKPPTEEESRQYSAIVKYLSRMTPAEKDEAEKFCKYYNEKSEKYHNKRATQFWKRVLVYALFFCVVVAISYISPFLGGWAGIFFAYCLSHTIFSSTLDDDIF